MLEGKLKLAFWLAVLLFASLPIAGILTEGPRPLQDPSPPSQTLPVGTISKGATQPVEGDMVYIPHGDFIRGTDQGGYNERPKRRIYLDAFWIDRFETTNFHYQQFVTATGHRKPGPPSRYATKMTDLRGTNQPVTYVSWDDADAYCQWRGKRLPTEAEWEKAMRGTDGRLWPWGNQLDITAANFDGIKDGFEYTAPVGSFGMDISPFGVADGAGNLMEWVADWYDEQAYRHSAERNPTGPPDGTYKVLRGAGYTSRGIDLRITSRMFMVPNFRDETLGFRCAKTGKPGDQSGMVARSNEEVGQRTSK